MYYQTAIHNEIHSAHSIEDVLDGHPLYTGLAIHYVRPKQVVYVRETLQSIIKDLVEAADDINLETNPSVVGTESNVKSIPTEITLRSTKFAST